MTIRSFFRLYWKTILAGLCIVYLSLAPPSDFEKVSIPALTFKGADKVIHFLMYFVFTVIVALDFGANRQRTNNNLRIFVRCILFPFLLGGLMEILQWKLTSHRSGDWFDLLANAAGIAAAYLLMKFIAKK